MQMIFGSVKELGTVLECKGMGVPEISHLKWHCLSQRYIVSSTLLGLGRTGMEICGIAVGINLETTEYGNYPTEVGRNGSISDLDNVALEVSQ